jgi:hypothetical protein
MLTRFLAIIASLAGTCAAANDVARVPVDDVRVLLVAAIDSPSGTAKGVLTSEAGRLITARFKASGPIQVDVTTERRYAQPSCSRLKVTFSQDGVQLREDSVPKRRTIEFGLNFCRTGLPPQSLS